MGYSVYVGVESFFLLSPFGTEASAKASDVVTVPGCIFWADLPTIGTGSHGRTTKPPCQFKERANCRARRGPRSPRFRPIDLHPIVIGVLKAMWPKNRHFRTTLFLLSSKARAGLAWQGRTSIQ